VLESAPDGGWTNAGARAEYFPLTYQMPEFGLELPRGYDFGARAEDRAAIDRMRRLGSPAVGGPLPPSKNGETPPHYLMAPIIYEKMDGVLVLPSGYLAGFVVTRLSPDELLARALPPQDTDVVANWRGGGDMGWDPGPPEIRAAPDGGIFFRGPIALGGWRWDLVCRMKTPSAGVRGTPVGMIGVAAMGGVITLLLTLLTASLIGRTRQIEKMVEQRTIELRRALTERRRLEREVLAVASREKHRVGRDLHDSLGQKLTGATLLARALDGAIVPTPDRARQISGQLGSTLKDAVTQVRRIARGLAPVELDCVGLSAALRNLCDESSVLLDVACVWGTAENEFDVDTATAGHVYLIAQESIHNAVRHGRARRIDVSLVRMDTKTACLRIQDNGGGFQPEATEQPTSGVGLQLMRHRAEMIDGRLSIASAPGAGTTVTCVFPLRPVS